jgi:acetyltransferase-like isoleucine patch superfamily enzyme
MKLIDEILKAVFRPFISPAVKDILLKDYTVWGDDSRLRIHPSAQVTNAMFNTVSGDIEIREHVFFGHHVSLLTGTHDITRTMAGRMEAVPQAGRSITVEEGAWIGSNATVIGPCTIGKNAVVASGSVVTRDVEANTVVGGNPAKFIKAISPDRP